MDAEAPPLRRLAARGRPAAGTGGAGLGAMVEWSRAHAERLGAGATRAADGRRRGLRAPRRGRAALAHDDARMAVLRAAEGAEAARSASPVGWRCAWCSGPSRHRRRPVAVRRPEAARAPAPASRARGDATGDQTRAMKRALYALQLIDARSAAARALTAARGRLKAGARAVSFHGVRTPDGEIGIRSRLKSAAPRACRSSPTPGTARRACARKSAARLLFSPNRSGVPGSCLAPARSVHGKESNLHLWIKIPCSAN